MTSIRAGNPAVLYVTSQVEGAVADDLLAMASSHATKVFSEFSSYWKGRVAALLSKPEQQRDDVEHLEGCILRGVLYDALKAAAIPVRRADVIEAFRLSVGE